MTLRPPRCAPCSTHELSLRSFFFFQAEDGIRDLTVTGVQTCALPIFQREHHAFVDLRRMLERVEPGNDRSLMQAEPQPVAELQAETVHFGGEPEIGRASCRERV